MDSNYLAIFCEDYGLLQQKNLIRLKFIEEASVIKKNYYNFIPSGSTYMLALLNIIKREHIKKSDSILDAGCGLSPVLLFLYLHKFSNLKGIDFNRDIIDYLINVNYLNNYDGNNNSFEQKDILKYDYKDHKLIYSYMPIHNTDLYIKYVNQVFNTMSKGSIFVDFYGMSNIATRKFNTKNMIKKEMKYSKYSICTYFKKNN